MGTKILALTTPLMALVFVTIFAVLWKRGNMGKHVLGFAVSYALLAIGYLITHFAAQTTLFVFHLTFSIYAIGTLVLLQSAALRVGRSIPLLAMGLIYAVTVATLSIATALTDQLEPRLYITNTAFGVMFMLGTMVLAHSRRQDLVDKLLLAIFVLSTVSFFTRPVITLLLESNIDTANYRDSVYYSILNVTLAMLSLLTALTLIAACLSDFLVSMRDQSDRDLLTGLRNRRAFEQEMVAMLERASVEGKPVGLVVADIDHFKQVNDLWGHQAGDAAITRFGELIETMVRDVDITGRIGGEEFCIAVWNCELKGAHRLAERIRAAFATMEHEGLNSDIRLTASFGVSQWDGAERYHRLFRRTDDLLYDAKESGRNRVASNFDRRRQKRGAPATEPSQVAIEFRARQG